MEKPSKLIEGFYDICILLLYTPVPPSKIDGCGWRVCSNDNFIRQTYNNFLI